MTARETGAVELKPCPTPWCEDSAPRPIRYTGIGGKPRWYIICEGCELDGPQRDTEAEAIAAWNTRPQPTPSATGEIVERALATLREVEDVLANGAHYGDDPECHPDYPRAVSARQVLQRHIEQQAATIAERNARIDDLEARLEIVNITVDQKPFKVMRETIGFLIRALTRSDDQYNLARERPDGQADDIYDLFAALTVNEGDSFVTFPTARYS